MNKRQFLKFALLSPLLLKLSCTNEDELLKGDEKSFDFLEVSGNYYEIGFQIGKKIKGTLIQLLQERSTWFNNVKEIANSLSGQQYSNKMYEKANNLFPDVIIELNGIAKGCELGFDDIWTLNLKNEFSNIVNQDFGSSSLYYKDKQNSWLFHNFESDKSFIDKLLMVKVQPPSGVGFYSLIVPGNLAGVAPTLNSMGFGFTMNPISSTNPEIGVPRNIICRAMIEAKNLTDSVETATVSPRALPAHHNIFSLNQKSYCSIETNPESKTQVNYYDNDLIIHTNHLLGDNVINYNSEDKNYIENYSIPKLKALQSLISSTNLPIKNSVKIMRIMSSHLNKPNSPCRHFDAKYTGNTLASVFFDASTHKMRVYKGNPCNAFANDNYCEYSF